MLNDLIFFITGIAVGSMNAVAGGGMLVGFPVMLALGMPPLVANITANVAVLPGNLGAAYSYRVYLRKVPKAYLLLLVPAAVGAAGGAILLRHTSFAAFNHLIPLLVLFAVVLFALQPFLYKELHRHMQSPKRKADIKSLVIISVALLPFAVYGGYFGAGFGFIMLAFLGFTKLHEHLHRMNALRTATTVIIALISVIFLYSTHLILWREGLIMGAGGLIGGYYGAAAVQRMSPQTLRTCVIVIGFSTAAYLGARTY
ncbi:MAG TPA: sulfite exporter TauE/SafE family protein [Candidatus Saccharimonadales bacterium]|nr:sulfite exporter TauE/SafE family protein [Candidatus Saccharimonadales bacterium]